MSLEVGQCFFGHLPSTDDKNRLVVESLEDLRRQVGDGDARNTYPALVDLRFRRDTLRYVDRALKHTVA